MVVSTYCGVSSCHGGRVRVPYAQYSAEEVADRGESIYEELIRNELTDGDRGKFLVIDIETGEYVIDKDDLSATRRALARRPDAVLYGLRIGYPTAYRLGGWTVEHR
jgi:hypothetical protein